MLPSIKMHISRHKPTHSSYSHKSETSSYCVSERVVNVQIQKHWYKFIIHRNLRLSAGVGFQTANRKWLLTL